MLKENIVRKKVGREEKKKRMTIEREWKEWRETVENKDEDHTIKDKENTRLGVSLKNPSESKIEQDEPKEPAGSELSISLGRGSSLLVVTAVPPEDGGMTLPPGSQDPPGALPSPPPCWE